MKPLKGDKKDLNRVKYLYFFLVLQLIVSADIYSQLPLNGFCSFRNIKVNPAFEKIFTIDFNIDNRSDFLLFNPANGNIALQKNYPVEKNITAISRFFQISISDIKPVIRFKKKELFYFAISQKDKKAALFSISSSGAIRVNLLRKFNSYPSYLAAADINGDGNSEAVVSGNNFEGISLFLFKGNLDEKKIVSKGTFSSVQFIDLNYDGYPDIAAFESRNNRLYFYINDRKGNFKETRNMKFDPSVKSFKIADANSDGYSDLIFVKQNGVSVFPGDSVSSFKKNYSLRTPVTPDEIAIDDFNEDGINDLAYMNKGAGEFYLQLNKGNGIYYYPILLLKRNRLSDMKSFRDSFSKKIVLLNPEGELYVFSKSNLKRELEKISTAGECSAIAPFDYADGGKKDLCIVDNYQKALILLLSEPGNPFAKYFLIRTSSSFDKVIAFDSKKNEKIFFLYSLGNNLIEIIKYNFETNNAEKNPLYLKGNIIDLKIKPAENTGYPNIYALTDKSNPRYAVYHFKSFHYSEISSSKLDGPFIDGAITYNDTLSVITWNINYFGCDNLSYSYLKPGRSELLYEYENKIQDEFELFTCAYPVNKNQFLNFTLIKNGSDIDCIFYESKKIKNIKLEGNKKQRAAFNKDGFYLLHNSVDKIKIFFIYDFGNSVLYKIDLNSKARIMSVKGAEKIDDIVSYIADKAPGKKMRIIYISRKDKSLNFKEIE